MHNNIMAAGSKDRPPMLGPGRYSQWRSRFLLYIYTKPNGKGLRKSILSGPYVSSTVLVQAIAATEGVPAVQQHTTIETVLNTTPENKEQRTKNAFCLKNKQFSCSLIGIGDDILFHWQLGITKESTLAGTRETSRCSYYKQSKLNWLAARYEEFGETGIGSTLQCYGKN
ncbi:hypothetical protein Tco_0817285 [Tanacetum coccineum]